MSTIAQPAPAPVSAPLAKRISAVRAVGAVAKRGLLIFFRYPGWVIGMVLWPLMFPAMYIFLARALAGPVDTAATAKAALGTANYSGYIVIGTMLWMWVNTTLWSIGTDLRQEQLGGTLESNWLTPSPRWGFLLGSAVFHAFSVFWLIGVALIGFVYVYGLHILNPLSTLVLFLANFPWVYGLGILFASLVIWAKEANGLVQAVRAVFLVFCGMSFPISILPGWMKGIANALPLTHGIDAVRSTALLGASVGDVSGQVLWLLGWGVGLLAAGFWAFNWTDRRMRRMGAAGTY